MKQFSYLICCGLVFFLLSGFEAGIEAEKLKNDQAEPSAPVLEYEEPVVSRESNQNLYQQYHLLIITSLEEASSTFEEDPAWSYSMAENACNYIKLLGKLLKEEHKDAFVNLNIGLNALMNDLQKRNLAGSRRKKLVKELDALADDLEYNFDFEKIQSWIKD
ncbi:MAG: hypothetical protein L6416_11635 [Candidatus Omnitrophica bacterium]|nr:hypothetical protein [Candidatus Omnitrophota bacterium]